MNMYRKITVGLLTMVSLTLLSGCGKASASTEEKTEAPEQETATEIQTESLNTNAERKLLYCITPSADNPYFVALQTACVEKGEELDYEVKLAFHGEDVDTQEECFTAAIEEEASAILCVNAGADTSAPSIQKAKNAGIPTFLVDREISQEGVAVAQIVADNRQGAMEVAKYLVDRTGGEGQYAELLGLESDANCQIRSEAFHAVFDETNMEMVTQQSADWDKDRGKAKTEKILRQYPEIVAVVCGNDTMACGAAEAVAEMNPDHEVYIIGMDGSDEMREHIREGKALATALQQVDLMARNAVNLADDYLTEGEKQTEEKQMVDCVLINSENVDQLENFAYHGN